MPGRARPSRRSFLGGALATAGGGGLAAIGCGGGQGGEQGTPQPIRTAGGEPRRGGTLRVATTATILSLDPHTTEGVSTASYFYSIDNEERRELAWDAQRLILKRHGPTLVLYQPYGYLAAYDHIKGYTPGAFGFGQFKYDYWFDKS